MCSCVLWPCLFPPPQTHDRLLLHIYIVLWSTTALILSNSVILIDGYLHGKRVYFVAEEEKPTKVINKADLTVRNKAPFIGSHLHWIKLCRFRIEPHHPLDGWSTGLPAMHVMMINPVRLHEASGLLSN